MTTETSTIQTRVPPIKVVGASRVFASLGFGALLGVFSGFAVSAIFWPAAHTSSLRTGLIVMSLLFGLFFGPLLTLMFVTLRVAALAQELAKKSGRSVLEHSAEALLPADFAAAGWGRLLALSVLGLGLGITAGFVIGGIYVQIMPAGDAVVFLAALLGGLLAVLTVFSVLVGRAARRRTLGEWA
jgi:hypothetical protein